ncbi:hypothetical protein DXK93_18210 [Achromobacter sp. K91]|uniref:Uncharacterized protein n=1 Tax=Achromobacter aegrifaciens TaxID=1287736 RepID=A0AAD2KI82_ACHAE|nr:MULTISPECIES: hypothetical protein [Achromobacter]MBD9381550.1 hypothetical protein [Achromobacter sp. ACM02]MBD9421123.1 hypothetical protein [Achromobacter sp. ACM04]MBD9431772.1 hypothetical protein [Achromobacter sp. ACM03]MDR7943759.1 hypothetical protein [Achromobacter aegrifaciens]RIJ02119.1 hypothetical protein DXK93_18210 [Achromobacter sp. K91]
MSDILPAQRTHARVERVALTIRIDTLDALNVRLALHRALGERIGVYVLSVDHVHAQSVLQLQCERGQLDALMHAVMSGLPRAEFGPVLPAYAMTGQ